MLGSIFPEKLIFSENTYRTAEPNEIVDFLSTIDATFKNNKDLVNPEKSDISCRVPRAGLEPAQTQCLQDFKSCVSTNSTTRANGAKDGSRTRDLNLGKVALYQLSYFRLKSTKRTFGGANIKETL
jgi:hypothetical protein